MINFSLKEKDFLHKMEVARIATISKKGWPQVTPILYVFDGKNIYFATDYDTKKYENINANKKVAIVVDLYARQPKGIMIQGDAKILERGKEFQYAYNLLQNRHAYYRANPFEEGEAPIIKIEPKRKVSWGI